MHFIESKHKFQNISKNFFHHLFQGKKSHFLAWLWRYSDYHSTHKNFVKQMHSWIYKWQQFVMNILRSKILTKTYPFLTARYPIFCTCWLQPPGDDCAVRVQWFSSSMLYIPVDLTKRCLDNDRAKHVFSIQLDPIRSYKRIKATCIDRMPSIASSCDPFRHFAIMYMVRVL